MASNSNQPYYAVARGAVPGIYRSWAMCKPMVHRYSNACYRKFDNAFDAWNFIHAMNGVSYGSYYSDSEPNYSGNSYYDSDSESYYNGDTNYDSDSESYYSAHTNNDSDSESWDPYLSERIPIYVDGAARGNGKWKNVRAGYGVFYDYGDSRNASVPLTHVDDIRYTPPTNQRAELHALDHALREVYNDAKWGGPKYNIYTDSAYGKNCLEIWCKKWSLNGWRTSAGKNVANSDIIKRAMNRYIAINNLYYKDREPKLSIIHVRAHSGNWGNEQADLLAQSAADRM